MEEIESFLATSRALLRRVFEISFAVVGEEEPRFALRSATLHMEHVLLSLGAAPARVTEERRLDVTESLIDFAVRLLKEPSDDQPSPGAESELSASGRPGFNGATSVLSLAEVLALLQAHEKSGLLRVVTRDETFSLGFEHGDLVYAFSDNSPPGRRLGEILVVQGAIEHERLTKFLEQHSSNQDRIGEALKREELVTKVQLEQAIRYQMQQLFLRAQEKEAFYTFTSGTPGAFGHPVRFGVVRLLLESARLLDEAIADRRDRSANTE